ncbi:hypothetical protein K504DRAFT_497880 [Pleomassaria siparia CBS 279.74]|uniref:Uncharacterized protein n=1 Tax=Pleomassaria siparia CBS 279.74 TaxID=1314801 RepID=A0A6G1KJN2_9PLEO|nr:hypothetical protein K504DRAFT_497880 [Pleomassaria siparia CBS 279.74]
MSSGAAFEGASETDDVDVDGEDEGEGEGEGECRLEAQGREKTVRRSVATERREEQQQQQQQQQGWRRLKTWVVGAEDANIPDKHAQSFPADLPEPLAPMSQWPSPCRSFRMICHITLFLDRLVLVTIVLINTFVNPITRPTADALDAYL